MGDNIYIPFILAPKYLLMLSDKLKTNNNRLLKHSTLEENCRYNRWHVWFNPFRVSQLLKTTVQIFYIGTLMMRSLILIAIFLCGTVASDGFLRIELNGKLPALCLLVFHCIVMCIHYECNLFLKKFV